MNNYDDTLYKHAQAFYPQPVAMACGNIMRATTASVRLDAVFKASETLCRYMAAVALSAFAARTETPVGDEQVEQVVLNKLKGYKEKDLTFGSFNQLIQRTAEAVSPFPLKAEIVVAVAQFKEPIQKLIDLRNEPAHEIANLSESHAETILATRKPEELLKEVLAAFSKLLDYPLFVMDESFKIVDGTKIGNRFLLMGEATEPCPEQIQLSGDLDGVRPYLGVEGGVLRLYPFLVWIVSYTKYSYNLFLIDSTKDKTLAYKAVNKDAKQYTEPSRYDELVKILNGELVPKQAVSLKNSQSFLLEWREKQSQMPSFQVQPIPWQDMETDTLRWYARKLGATGQNVADFQQHITERLLDGRETLRPDEIRQLVLLLGTPAAIKNLTGRDLMLDCKPFDHDILNEDGRKQSGGNVPQCLTIAIDFYRSRYSFSENGKTIDGLTAKDGTGDYIAMREGLVNLFIHQDYHDSHTTAQIISRPNQVTFYNAGCALISEKALEQGGFSTARNPLISRALKLIKFAELAGSGIVTIRRAWQQAQRNPPQIESNASNNTYRITLDWTKKTEPLVEFWRKQNAPVDDTDKAIAMVLAGQPDGLNQQNLSVTLGVPLEVSAYIIKNLLKNALVQEHHNRYFLTPAFQSHWEQANQIYQAQTSPSQA